MVYVSLALVAFLAATLLPLQSEATLFALLMQHRYQPIWLLLAACLGNIAGSCFNWWLGTGVEQFKEKRWFPFKPRSLQKAKNYFSRYGQWIVILSWLPIVGDPLTLVAGILRMSFWRFLVLVTLGKVARYVAVYYLFLINTDHYTSTQAFLF